MSSTPPPLDVADAQLPDASSTAFASTTPKYNTGASFIDEESQLPHFSEGEDEEEDDDICYQSMVQAGNEAVDYINQSFGHNDEMGMVLKGDDDADFDGEDGEAGQIPVLRQSAEVQLTKLNLSNASENAEWRLMGSDDESIDSGVVMMRSPHKRTPNSTPPKAIASSSRTPLKTLSEKEVVDDENRGLRGTGWKEVRAAPKQNPEGELVDVDEWRAAKTPEGKEYFYNRRTRQSAWILPEGATPSKNGAFCVPRTEGKPVPQRPRNRQTPSSSSAKPAPSRISSIVTPSRNPTVLSQSPMMQMTPDGEDPQERQRKAQARKDAREKARAALKEKTKEKLRISDTFLSDTLNSTANTTSTSHNNNNNHNNNSNDNSTLSTTKKKQISLSRAETSAKSASQVLENSHIYEQLDKTFTSDLNNASFSVSKHAQEEPPTAQKFPIPPSANKSANPISPPPPLVHNGSRRRLFDENAAATQSVFCVYCGHQTPPNLLKDHMGECFVFQRTWQSENGTQQVVEGAIMKAWGMNLVKDNKSGGAAAGAKAKPKARPKSKSSLPAVVKEKDEAKPKANNVVSPDSRANALFVCPGCNDSSSKSRPELLAHLRSCTAALPDAPNSKYGGAAEAGQVCPYCAQPCIKLSNHLARCRIAKRAKAKALVPG
eukprot:CAMPEP_0182477494 /NCGR_PEP_ID=MMETSP1319-20130603/30941_1 /TAXON_ID=172717 /ORGANISM="Bolidomonas pacifica, Strain RCC208" /LENGTH=659 /DNA_ID=CAMNT_0024678731 /DNA_START=149 /DNA_END=2125 /DNA_ORIENTATION=+